MWRLIYQDKQRMVHATVLSTYLTVRVVTLSGKTNPAEQWESCPHIYIDGVEKDQNSMQIDREIIY